ncbi:hypothetical protein [Pseudomonas sp. WS 5079]|uniref:hypothetical protein n=1 Tax=Pseudomonas sp. WS 5079 TaxID=2717492 RepID=UPI0015521646|nr:hypothetical protein [Pseudomonas sp. WS 5079]NMX65447.1 hypothetical protein [Pseudomonas sp. WS 5079]
MKNFSTEKCLLACFVVLTAITNANAALDPKCYDNIQVAKGISDTPLKNPDGSDKMVDTKKPISIDIAFPNPLPAGGTATFDLSKSKVPSVEMETPAPVLHPEFTLISSTKYTYTYKIPIRASDYHGKFTVIDTYCGFSNSQTKLLMPVR